MPRSAPKDTPKRIFGRGPRVARDVTSKYRSAPIGGWTIAAPGCVWNLMEAGSNSASSTTGSLLRLQEQRQKLPPSHPISQSERQRRDCDRRHRHLPRLRQHHSQGLPGSGSAGRANGPPAVLRHLPGQLAGPDQGRQAEEAETTCRVFAEPEERHFASDVHVASELARLGAQWDSDDVLPNEALPDGNKTKDAIYYGMPEWRDMFSQRQLLAHAHCVQALRQCVDADASRMDDLRRSAWAMLQSPSTS